MTSARSVPLLASLMIGIFFCYSRAEGLKSFSIPLGIQMEHNFNNQWGIRAGVSHDQILKGRPRLSISYTTSRIGELIGRNLLLKDNLLFGIGWHFRPFQIIDPQVRLDIGFTRFDLEDEEIFAHIDNRSAVIALNAGLELKLLHGIIRPWIDGGYSFVTSSTVLPLQFSFGIDCDIVKGMFR